MENKKPGLQTAALVLGIIAIATSFLPIINNASFALGIIAVVFGLITLFKKINTTKSVISIILGILAVIITLVMQQGFSNALDKVTSDMNSEINNMTGDSTEDILKNNIEVAFGEFTVNDGEFLDDSKLEVTVKNIGGETKTFNITVEALSKDGVRIATDVIYANSLTSGQSAKYNIFTLVTEEKAEELKNATFKVAEASMY